MFTAFMIFTLTASFALVIYRLPLLRARNELDSWISREASFLVNNWVLLFCAFFVLFATMFPTLSDAIRGERLTVAAPFYNKWMAPVGFVLLFLTGVGPLLAWRKSTLDNLRQSFTWPTLSASRPWRHEGDRHRCLARRRVFRPVRVRDRRSSGVLSRGARAQPGDGH
jgi:cytochrome c-type biogenesis protein CcmF